MIDADVHPSRRPQIAGLIAKKDLTKVSVEYTDFADVFFLDLASELLEYTEINDHSIELVNANGLNKPFMLLAGAPIFFDWNSDRSLWLCVDYRGPNSLTIAMLVSRWPIQSR